MSQVTTLLAAIGQGKPDALGELYALLYPELRRLAHSRVRRSGDMTLLETTALVHESYLRFEKSGALAIGERAQFMAYAARVMRSVVVDMIRARHSERRGGDAVHVDLDVADVEAAPGSGEDEVLRVHAWRRDDGIRIAAQSEAIIGAPVIRNAITRNAFNGISVN